MALRSQNPADIASRGKDPEALSNCKLWWKGPQWLAEPSTVWPLVDKLLSAKEINEETRRVVCYRVKVETDFISRFSSLTHPSEWWQVVTVSNRVVFEVHP